MRSRVLAAAYLLDCLAGDPQWFPHPVRLIGKCIHQGEKSLRRIGPGPWYDFTAGSLLAGGLTVSSGLFTYWVLRQAYRKHRSLGMCADISLAWTCLATRSLLEEASNVIDALEAGDLTQARSRVSRIVGRDTQNLDATEISRAVIETLAESLCDGIIAPMFYLALCGVPTAMAYKTINTLDSMIGHRDDRYIYFGRAAARLDDIANFLPSRLTALLIGVSSLFMQPQTLHSSLTTWLRDGGKHASPNAGQSESAMAGALQVCLGGTNTYCGEAASTNYLGAEFKPPSIPAARSAMRLTAIASLLGFAAACVFIHASKHD